MSLYSAELGMTGLPDVHVRFTKTLSPLSDKFILLTCVFKNNNSGMITTFGRTTTWELWIITIVIDKEFLDLIDEAQK